MSDPTASGVEAAAGRSRRPGHARGPRATASISSWLGSGSRCAQREHEVRDRVGGVGPGQIPRRGGHRGVRGRVGEQPRDLDQPVGVEVLVLDQDRGTGGGLELGVAPLVPGGVRVGHDRHRQARSGRLGDRRGAGPPDGQVGGGEGRGHVVAVEERVRPVAVAQVGGQRLPAASAAA